MQRKDSESKRTLIFDPAVVGRVFADDETFSGKSDTINLLKNHRIKQQVSKTMFYCCEVITNGL